MGPMISRVKEMTRAVLAVELRLEMEGRCRMHSEQPAWLTIVANRFHKNARLADAGVSFELEELWGRTKVVEVALKEGSGPPKREVLGQRKEVEVEQLAA